MRLLGTNLPCRNTEYGEVQQDLLLTQSSPGLTAGPAALCTHPASTQLSAQQKAGSAKKMRIRLVLVTLFLLMKLRCTQSRCEEEPGSRRPLSDPSLVKQRNIVRRYSDLDYDSFVGLMGRRSTEGEMHDIFVGLMGRRDSETDRPNGLWRKTSPERRGVFLKKCRLRAIKSRRALGPGGGSAGRAPGSRRLIAGPVAVGPQGIPGVSCHHAHLLQTLAQRQVLHWGGVCAHAGPKALHESPEGLFAQHVARPAAHVALLGVGLEALAEVDGLLRRVVGQSPAQVLQHHKGVIVRLEEPVGPVGVALVDVVESSDGLAVQLVPTLLGPQAHRGEVGVGHGAHEQHHVAVAGPGGLHVAGPGAQVHRSALSSGATGHGLLVIRTDQPSRVGTDVIRGSADK
ncbi:hypothetical protein N1851_001646 [Merluccius polli]|uniref:Neurokinin-B n=1 Tax=Merluccius polli TaxID=89951 RepID=A0AA47N3T7_MERPO|nr:hypothetical protein N1851_007348 [Merluccius polli]KAK0155854.1 hypothetical protein N1851_001646 [Merluccius polli]